MPGAYPSAEVSEFDTSLGMRLDYEACLAYLAFPPIGAIVLLILERNSDYVRYVPVLALQDDLARYARAMPVYFICLRTEFLHMLASPYAQC